MTTPIERAAQALRDAWQENMKASPLDKEDARTVFESIDVQGLADILEQLNGLDVHDTALTIKEWLLS